MTEITQADRETSVAIRCALYRAVAGIPSYPQGIVEPYLARHREQAEQETVAKIVADLLKDGSFECAGYVQGKWGKP